MNPNDIKELGKRMVEQQLKNKGWSQVNTSENVPNPVDVIAAHDNKTLIIKVTPAVAPNQPPQMDPQEAQQMRALAQQNNAHPYQVKLALDQTMQNVNSLTWEKL